MKSNSEYIEQKENDLIQEYVLNLEPTNTIKRRVLFMYNRNESYNQLMTIYKKFIINSTDCLKSFKLYCKKYDIERIHDVIGNVKIVNAIFNDEIVHYRKHFDVKLPHSIINEIDENGLLAI